MPDLGDLIAEYQQRPLPSLTPREGALPLVPGMATVVTGVRRCGKTFRLFQEMARLRNDEGVEGASILYLNLEDDRLQPANVELLSGALETFYRLNPPAREEGAFLFFDEIQAVPDWSRFLRRVLDTEKARVYATGSSARLLSREVATEFRGRGYAAELLPYSFRETIQHAGETAPASLPGAQGRSRLEASFAGYLEVGGFPAVQNIEEPVRVQTLQDYVELVLLRDIIERHGVSNAVAARAFVRTLIQSSGRPFTVNKTYHAMRSQGIEVGKDTLHALLAYAEDAFLAFAVPRFSPSQRVRATNPRKVYCVDPGLARAVSHVSASDLGQRLETAVYLALRRRSEGTREGTISHYVTQAGHEVDFVIGEPDELAATALVHVCADVSQPETRVREVRALTEAMTELHLSASTLVTLHERDVIGTPAGEISVVPAWQWALGLA